MQERLVDIKLVIFQSLVVLSLLVILVGVLRPQWFLGWMKNPKPVYMFAAGSLLFLVSYFFYSLRIGNPWQVAAIHAVVLFSVIFLIFGLINPRWVFGTDRLDRLWVMAIAAALFMGFMTLLGMYYGPKNKRRMPPPSRKPAVTAPQANQTPAAPGPANEAPAP